jgi:tRNA(Ile)-lysidine synthase
MDLEQRVRRVISRERLLDAGDTVLVGVSGGIDSSTLLFLLNRIKHDLDLGLAVGHINHRLRGEESERDEVFVKGLADKYGLPCHTARIDVGEYAREQGLSVQHAGRDVRYRYFEEWSRDHGYRKIAIGHNRDDQVETFLLRLIKGTGIHGLASIPIKRGPLIRPLLCTYRAEIAAYAEQCSLPYMQDSSNLKEAYERNFIRRRIAPLMEQLNPRFREKILLLLSDIASINTVFDEEASRFLEGEEEAEGEGFRVRADRLGDLHGEVRFRVITLLLARLEPRFIALREHVLLVEKSLRSRRPNNVVTLPHGIRVKRVYGDLLFTKKGDAPQVGATFAIEAGENAIPLLGITLDVSLMDERPQVSPKERNIAFFDAARISDLALRTFREGDRFTPLGMTGSVKVKDYFISRKIPADRRRQVPLLLTRGEIIWIVGERISDDFKVTTRTKRVLRVAVGPR